MGASVDAFLFGAMRSYATYSGKVLGGLLELGGPVVVFAMVMIGGYWLIPNIAVELNYIDSISHE